MVNKVRHRYVWQTILKFTEAGWHCIDDYVWHKANSMPGYWPTRLRDSWEYVFHLSKSKKPYMDQEAVRIPIGDWASRCGKLGARHLKRHHSMNGSGFARNRSRWTRKNRSCRPMFFMGQQFATIKDTPAVFPLALPSFFIKLFSCKDSLVIDVG